MRNLNTKIAQNNYQQYRINQNCCICGLQNCQQAVDHQKVTLNQLTSLINEKCSNKQSILIAKQRVNQFYKSLKWSILALLQKNRSELLYQINKLALPKQFCSENKIYANIISEVMQKNIKVLPSKKIKRLIQKVQSLKQQQNCSNDLKLLQQKITKIISLSNLKSIVSSFKKNLPSIEFIQTLPEIQIKRKKTSASQSINPQQQNDDQKLTTYEWKNVRVTKNSKTVSLSNKNISDIQVMQQIPLLSNFKNLKEFEIRNNKITCLTCSLIANNMPFLLTVDIRGNRITDKGIIKLIRGIPKMKSFFISQTLATDQSGQEIVNKLDDLEVLWAQHTRLSNEIALKIASKTKLKILSLVGNPIDDQYKQKMKRIFISKGYITL